MIRWRIFYGDYSTFGNRDGSPFEAPMLNVQIINKETPAGPRPFKAMSADHYIWREDNQWIGCDLGGLYDYLMMYRGPKAVLWGRTLRDDLWQEIGRWANKEGLG